MMGGRKVVQWLDLPPELWSEVAKRLPPEEMDHLRFRSICSLWRSSTPPLQKPPLPWLPRLRPTWSTETPIEIPSLVERSVYLIQIPEDTCRKLSVMQGFKPSFLIKISKPLGKLHLESLLCNNSIDQYPKTKPSHHQSRDKVLNLWNLRVTELSRAHTPQIESGIMVLQISRAGAAIAIDADYQLYYYRPGDKEWNSFERLETNWEDVIYYQGQFCAIDYDGRALLFDSSFAPTQISQKMVIGPNDIFIPKRLVESHGELFMVEFYEEEQKVYRLNMEEKAWIEVKSLGDRMFFLAQGYSFSVSAQDFPGCKGNCVYSRDTSIKDKGDERLRFCGPCTKVYDLETGRFGEILSFPEYLEIFWPPPKWLENPTLLTLAMFRTLI